MDYAHLTINDQRAICKTLRIPYPTAETPLPILLAQEKIQPADVLVRLERSRDLSAMIAAAALRGKVTVCPKSAQLNPKPYPKAPVASPKTEDEGTRLAVKPIAKQAHTANATRVLATVQPNPKRPGSASRDRYALYQVGMTEAQLLERGVRRDDFRHDTQRGYITWAV